MHKTRGSAAGGQWVSSIAGELLEKVFIDADVKGMDQALLQLPNLL